MLLTDKTKHLASKLDKSILSSFSDNIYLIDENLSIKLPAPAHQCIVVSKKNLEPNEIIDIVWNKGIRHVIQESHDDLEAEVSIAAQMIEDLTVCLNNPLKFFKIKQKQFSFSINKTQQKAELKNKISKFIKTIPSLNLLEDSINIIIDELFMNAFYDAPADDQHQHLYANLPRTEQVELRDDQSVEFFICYDDKKAIIGCKDPFGSFNENKFLKRFFECYIDELSTVSMGAGGAGIGCRMIFEYSSSVYFASLKGQETLVCSKIFTHQAGKQLTESAAKNFHVAII